MFGAPVFVDSLLSGATSSFYYLPICGYWTPTKSLPLQNMIDTTVDVYQLFRPSCVLFYLSFSLIVYSRCLSYVFVWLVETLLLPPVTNIKRLTLVNRGCIFCLCVNSYFFCRYSFVYI
jgi:hypothetical protein